MKAIFLINLIIPLQIFAQIPNQYEAECNLWRAAAFEEPSKNALGDVYSWSFVQTPVTAQITEIFFIDSLKGWGTHTGTGSIRTTNGGMNWDSTSFHDSTFTTSYSGVYFINQNIGWCVGGAVQIRKTTNGGITWFKQYAPPVAGVLNGIYFWNENTGLAIGRKTASFNSFIARTTNGGVTWTEIVATTNSNNELHDQYWFDENTGWISGRDVLLKSTNGGLNYVNLYANIPPTSNGANALLSIWFVNQQTGWIGGSNADHLNIYKTTNGGTNWFFQPNPVANYTYAQINDVKFKSQDTGWAIHGTPFSGAIMITTDAGSNWIIEDGTNIWFDCMAIYQKMKAWVGAGSGRVYYADLILTGISTNDPGIPNKFGLYQNYPNPFNLVTRINFDLPRQEVFTFKIYDVAGKEIYVITDFKPAGSYSMTFDAGRLASGVYFYSLHAGEFFESKRMVVVK